MELNLDLSFMNNVYSNQGTPTGHASRIIPLTPFHTSPSLTINFNNGASTGLTPNNLFASLSPYRNFIITSPHRQLLSPTLFGLSPRSGKLLSPPGTPPASSDELDCDETLHDISTATSAPPVEEKHINHKRASGSRLVDIQSLHNTSDTTNEHYVAHECVSRKHGILGLVGPTSTCHVCRHNYPTVSKYFCDRSVGQCPGLVFCAHCLDKCLKEAQVEEFKNPEIKYPIIERLGGWGVYGETAGNMNGWLCPKCIGICRCRICKRARQVAPVPRGRPRLNIQVNPRNDDDEPPSRRRRRANTPHSRARNNSAPIVSNE